MYNKEFSEIYDLMGWDIFSKNVYDDIKKKANKNSSVLDIACGTGELAGLFYHDNFDVSGFDKSREMIKIAKKKNKKINFFVDDMGEFKLNKKFGLITCMYDSINHIKDWKSFFKRVYDHLSDDGVFVFDYNTIKGLESWNNTFLNKIDGGYTVVSGEYNKNSLSADLEINCFVKKKDGKNFSHIRDTFHSCTYSNKDIKKWLKETGFSCVNLYPQSKNNRRKFLVCRKKKILFLGK